MKRFDEPEKSEDARKRAEDLLEAALEGHEQLTPDDLRGLGELARDLADEAEEESRGS